MKRSSRKTKTAAHARAAETHYDSRSLAKGLEILDCLSRAPAALPLKDLSELAGLGKASTLRLLRTLEAKGYLVRDANDHYAPGRDWPSTREQDLPRLVREAAMPFLTSLNAEFGETVALAFLFDDVIRVLEVIESPHLIRTSNFRGGILQPYASSLGKSIAACQSAEKTHKLLYTYGILRLTPATLTDFRSIHEDLAAVRKRGYAWDREETVRGGRCIGAPIQSPGGEVAAAISMSMPISRFTKRLEELLPTRIMECASQIGKALKAAGNGKR